ncbi:MAG: aminomethyl-transferring glycine dehydrogenase [Bacteroidetes bacterium]|nr:aminomethyl-transferring glycine dehydrogenase [Bacteroidota bacterium]
MTIHSNTDTFSSRHIGPSAKEQADMLKAIGAESLDSLISDTIPADIRLRKPLQLPAPLSEPEMLAHIWDLAAMNKVYRTFIGRGYYDTHVPSVIRRNILENPGWYTQYTPYQAEIAQGRLEALLNFQTMVIDLTGMEIANASLLDEGTAAAEAMTMLYGLTRQTRPDAHTFLVAGPVFSQTLDVLTTRAEPVGINIRQVAMNDVTLSDDVFGIFMQYPDANGEVSDIEPLIRKSEAAGILTVVAADLLSLVLLKAPGESGASVVVGTTQRFGVPMGFGGPHAGYFATREAFKRNLPGRIIGVSIDADGNPALRMALQTREQHIRRDKATSNICTAQVLLAVMASMYAVYHGSDGLKAIATHIHSLAVRLGSGLRQLGLTPLNSSWFDTIRLDLSGLPGGKDALAAALDAKGINIWIEPSGLASISVDETKTQSDIDDLLGVFAGLTGKSWSHVNGQSSVIPGPLRRQSAFLTHPVFNRYHSETDMMRYIKQLENKDLSLNFSMIPLGSCTMKLNAATEMIPLTWSEYSSIHPFVPASQARGYLEMICSLGMYLCEITGFSGISFQPNSGAQGEYAGLLTIRAWHKSKNQDHRDVVLIPSSAHGTNPASAVMAGYQVVVVGCDALGNIDLADLQAKIEQYRDRLSSLMVTYPSTHGVFESAIRSICQQVHDAGGLVYMDGANMNAQVGLTSPAMIGADVCHLNLHKTFCIPHGGGGPGVGPIAVAEHLVPFLPGHPVVETGGNKAIHAVSSAPYGSALILLISYAYIKMMGGDSLRAATEVAILNANYIKSRLEKEIPVLYQGEKGCVAHEAIFDLRPFKPAGIEAEDVAKRLMDYGFHAPTVSFPVAGTIMIEPTESESRQELDRFCDALLSIREEIREIEQGVADRVDNVLKNAPHTVGRVTADSWTHAYSRSKAAWPLPYLKEKKFWPSVARVNNAHGDRTLICSCPPVSEYMTSHS